MSNQKELLATGTDIVIEQNAILQRKLTVAIEALKFYSWCHCGARFSGFDENEYRARGCPKCYCLPEAFTIAREALKAIEQGQK